MEREVIVKISPAGNAKVEANNFQGVGCAAATESIEVVLGGPGQIKKRKDFKPEYFMPSTTGAVENKMKW